jgi:DNA-binding NtrC family response regulator
MKSEMPERILLVEDDSLVAEAVGHALHVHGFDVVHVEAAETALALARRDNFDLVVSDISLAGLMNGIILAHSLRSIHPLLPIILATGQDAYLSEASRDFAVLRKPFQIHELMRLLRERAIKPNSALDAE